MGERQRADAERAAREEAERKLMGFRSDLQSQVAENRRRMERERLEEEELERGQRDIFVRDSRRQEERARKWKEANVSEVRVQVEINRERRRQEEEVG